MPSGRPPLALLLGVAAIVALAIAHSGEIGARTDAALGIGMPTREAELARGFVLGEDDRIDPRTVEDFRRSGLSHLLAVSGQNVALLALLAMPVLGALGIPLRARLVWVLALIAVYVPLTGAGPSIQRAGVGPINALNALLLACIAQVAAWCGRPGWAYFEVRIGLAGLLGSYAAIFAGALAVHRLSRWRRIEARDGGGSRSPGEGPGSGCGRQSPSAPSLSSSGRSSGREAARGARRR